MSVLFVSDSSIPVEKKIIDSSFLIRIHRIVVSIYNKNSSKYYAQVQHRPRMYSLSLSSRSYPWQTPTGTHSNHHRVFYR